jgi:hypothetical protein
MSKNISAIGRGGLKGTARTVLAQPRRPRPRCAGIFSPLALPGGTSFSACTQEYPSDSFLTQAPRAPMVARGAMERT